MESSDNSLTIEDVNLLWLIMEKEGNEMRYISTIVLHCSDSDEESHDDINVIDKWHKDIGFDGCGYHFFVRKNGTIEIGRQIETQGAHAHGFNKHSIGICFSGRDEFTKEQFQSASKLIINLQDQFGIDRNDIIAHNDLNKYKTCPNFSVVKFRNKYCKVLNSEQY